MPSAALVWLALACSALALTSSDNFEVVSLSSTNFGSNLIPLSVRSASSAFSDAACRNVCRGSSQCNAYTFEEDTFTCSLYEVTTFVGSGELTAGNTLNFGIVGTCGDMSLPRVDSNGDPLTCTNVSASDDQPSPSPAPAPAPSTSFDVITVGQIQPGPEFNGFGIPIQALGDADCRSSCRSNPPCNSYIETNGQCALYRLTAAVSSNEVIAGTGTTVGVIGTCGDGQLPSVDANGQPLFCSNVNDAPQGVIVGGPLAPSQRARQRERRSRVMEKALRG